MNDEPESDITRSTDTPTTTERVPLARWKKILMIVSGVLVAGGLALFPFESSKREELSTSQASGQGQVIGPDGQLVPSGQGQGAPGEQSTGDPELSPSLMKMGFSFFAAFAIGLAFRSFVKVAMIIVGVQLLALFGLSYAEWITVNWETISSVFDRFAKAVETEAGSFQTFITGSLPQAGLGALGLVAGFKR